MFNKFPWKVVNCLINYRRSLYESKINVSRSSEQVFLFRQSFSSLAHWYPQNWFPDLTARHWFCCSHLCSICFLVHQLNCSYFVVLLHMPSFIFFLCVRMMQSSQLAVFPFLFHLFLLFVNNTVCVILEGNICIRFPGKKLGSWAKTCISHGPLAILSSLLHRGTLVLFVFLLWSLTEILSTCSRVNSSRTCPLVHLKSVLLFPWLDGHL